MLTGPPRRRRARPVADAPIEALLERTEDLAKGWLLALLERAPLDDAPRILAADLTREGPRVCAAMLRAIADETDHRRLEPGGALQPLVARVGELAGAAGAAATSLAVDELQSVMWSALRSELRNPDPDLITELAERLAQVTGLMRAAALEHGAGAGSVRAPISAAPEPWPAPEPPPVPEPPPAPPFSWPPARTRASAPASGEGPADPAPPPTVPPPEPAAVAAPGRELWVDALEDEIRAAADMPLSLLLAELEDADRVRAVETDPAGAVTRGAFGSFARAVREVARHQDILVCESDARAWIIARDTGRPGAQALGTRIAAAVRAREPWRGAPLSASVGIAVLSEDGHSAAELIEAAEEARFAAAAEGVDVLRAPKP
jgi:GGDEF domain-containing protein